MSRPLVSALTLAVVLSSSLAPAQADEQGATRAGANSAIAEFKKYAGNDNENVRKAAADGLGECNHLDVVRLLLGSLVSDSSPIVKAACITALAKQTTKAALHEMTRELKTSTNVEEKTAILEAFKSSKPAVAYDTVLGLVAGKKFELRFPAAQLLGVLPAPDNRSRELLVSLTADTEPQIRLVAIDSLILLNHPEAAAKCIERLQKDTDWRVRAAAIKALEAFRLESSIQPLIDAMRQEEGRLKDDAHATLKALTGFGYSGTPDVWQRWWDRVKDTFKLPTLAEMRQRKRQEEDALAEYGKGPEHGYTPYHGIKTRSKRILFLLDISHSMVDKVILAGATKEQAAEFDRLYGGYRTKIDLAREQLINTVAAFESHVKFNIVTFNAAAQAWKPNLVRADAGKNEAVKYLSRLTPEYLHGLTMSTDMTGKTNTYEALQWALGLAKLPNDKPTKDHTVEADTVFLLTDGMPTEGKITDPAELVRMVLTVNARAKIVFHTITFGHGNETLLKPLADESGGRYVEIGY